MTYRLSNYINKKFGTRILSKWIVLSFDIFITAVIYIISYVLRFNFHINSISFSDFTNNVLVTTVIFTLAFLFFKTYDGIIRHSGIADAVRLIKAGITAIIICLAISIVSRTTNFNFIYLATTTTLLALSRRPLRR